MTVDGIFSPCTEITEQVVGVRPLETLRRLGFDHRRDARVTAASQEAVRVLAENAHDVPFAAVYVLDEAGRVASLTATTADGTGLPASVAYSEVDGTAWPLATVLRTQLPAIVKAREVLGQLPVGCGSSRPRRRSCSRSARRVAAVSPACSSSA